MNRPRSNLIIKALWAAALMACVNVRADVSPAGDLVERILRANQSAGFDIHAQLTKVDHGEVRTWRLYIAGRSHGEVRQVLVRALQPKAWSDQSVIASAERAGPIHITAASADKSANTIKAWDSLFDSGLTLWDLLGAWWYWPRQVQVGSESLLDRPCIIVESSGGGGSGVALVRSWISPDLRMPLRVDLYGQRGGRLQRLDVVRITRRKDGSGMMRAMDITNADGGSTSMEIYNGSENAELPANLFDSAPDKPRTPSP